VQVLLQRVLGVDRDVVKVRQDLVLGIVAGAPLARQRARDIVARGDLGNDRPQPAARGDQPDRRRDRRLPDAALAGDDEQLLGQGVQSSPSQ
jgi:hypothetical protein